MMENTKINTSFIRKSFRVCLPKALKTNSQVSEQPMLYASVSG